MKRLLVLALFYLISCHNDKPGKQIEASSTDTLRQTKASVLNTDITRQASKQFDNKNELIGIWASDDKEPITIDITADSIFYIEHFEAYKYEVKEDSIFIRYPDFIFSAKVYFDLDTMILQSEDGKSKYYKFEE